MNNIFQVRQTLSNINVATELLPDGFCWCNTSCSGMPKDGSYGYLLVFRNAKIFIEYLTNRIYCGMTINNIWSGWTSPDPDVERVAFIEGGILYKTNKFVFISLNKTITKNTIGWNTLSSAIPTAKDRYFAPYTSSDLAIQGVLSISSNILEIDIPSNAVGKTFTVRGQIMYRLA